MAEDKNMALYGQLQTPPENAIKEIKYGALKGKSDINPQWRYEALTAALGPCGVGWKFEVVKTETLPVNATGELMIFVLVNLYWFDEATKKWSEPIPGYGGDFLIKKDRNGIHGNDEAYKMAATDAIGTAAKMLGVAADIYRGFRDNGVSDSKYAARSYQQEPRTINDYYQLVVAYARKNSAMQLISPLLQSQFQKQKFSELTLAEAKTFCGHIAELVQKAKAAEDEKLTKGV